MQDVVQLVVVNTIMDESKRSWTFKRHTLEDRPDIGIAGTVPEPVYGLSYIRELYERHNTKHAPDQEVKPPFPVPTLWDRKLEKIVSNDSADMMRWFSTAWNDLLPPEGARLDLSPANLTAKMDELYSWGSRDVAGGVYKAGFAPTQKDYDAAVPPLFAGLDRLESLVVKNGGPYVWGDRLTESDIWVRPRLSGSRHAESR